MQWRLRIIVGAISIAALAAIILGVWTMRQMRAPQPVDIPTWASTVCGATATFGETLVRVRDSVDPSTLDLAARKARAARIGKAELEASKRFAADLDAVRPPDAVTAYHAALLASANEYAKTTEEQLDVVAKAANAQQIAVANASARFRLSGADQNVAAAGNNLPPAALAALRDEPKCGPSRPGAPPTPGV